MDSINEATAKLAALDQSSLLFKTLNAMLNGPGSVNDSDFLQTQNVVANQINSAPDLETLARDYEDLFFLPFLSNGGSPSGQQAHVFFGRFNWFIMMEEKEDPNLSVYRAMQPLFIGTGCARPAKVFVKLHELISRIVHMRGGAEDLTSDIDDEDEEVDALGDMEAMTLKEKVQQLQTQN
ncbi:hypothetical protein HDU98_002286 [Podochytrium sp. JEL0797]|nr:hypothetical protein HDU98_002286 [Podochytrium sp. JEL0797]